MVGVVVLCSKCKIRPRVKYKNSHGTWCINCKNEATNIWKKKRNYKYTSKAKPQFIVYCYFDISLSPLYVGRGKDSRVKYHHKKDDWTSRISLLLTMTCDNEWETMELEGRWGNLYKPEFNKQGNRY